MGYYTKYHISAVHAHPSDEPLAFNESFFNSLQVPGFDADEWVLRNDGRCALYDGEDIRWYEHDTDMLRISKEWPTVVFILDGDGEETGDLWRKFYCNGKLHKWVPNLDRPDLTKSVKKSLGLK